MTYDVIVKLDVQSVLIRSMSIHASKVQEVITLRRECDLQIVVTPLHKVVQPLKVQSRRSMRHEMNLVKKASIVPHVLLHIAIEKVDVTCAPIED